MENRTKLAFLWIHIQFAGAPFVVTNVEFPPHKRTKNANNKNALCFPDPNDTRTIRSQKKK